MGPNGIPNPPSVSMNQAQNVFRYGEQSLWSSQFLPGTSTLSGQSFRLFSTQRGQQGQGYTAAGLSIAETNLKLPGQVPGGAAYDVFGVACQIMHSTAAADSVSSPAMNEAANNSVPIADLINVVNNGVFSWDFQQTTVQIAPCMLIGQGGGAFGAVATTVDNVNDGHMNNGNGGVWLYRTYPVALPGTTVFGIVLDFGTRAPAVGANGIGIRCVLLGYYKTVVEVAN